MRVTRPRNRTVWLAASVGAGLFLTLVAAEVESPTATSEGNWHGTWQFTSRAERLAFFMRQPDAGPVELRVRFAGTRPYQRFETDWTGSTTYSVAGRPASFELSISERTDDRIRGTITWEIPASGDVRERRTGHFVLFREFDGRRMQLRVDNFETKRFTPEEVLDTRVTRLEWNFLKRSKRIVLWDELPY